MLRKGLIPVWVGILALSGMFLLGQDSWGPEPPPPVTKSINLCQKDLGTWECVVDGASGTFSYQTTGEPELLFDLAAQGLDAETDYRLIYYVDTYSPWRSGKPVGMCLSDVLTPETDGTLVSSGSVATGDLPWPDDLNCPDGAKIWLVADADADCTGPRILTVWNPAPYLFDDTALDLVKFDDLTETDPACNAAPVADAGDDQGVSLGDLVTLDGSASYDPESEPLTYAWSLVAKPSGSAAVLDNPGTAGPTFTADKEGVYEVQLVVYDGVKDSLPDTVSVTTTAPTSTANLCEKNSSWLCKDPPGATATLTYNTIGNPELDFTLNAQGLAASTGYTLIYYPDPWPGSGLLCLASGESSEEGGLTLTGSVTPGDLPLTCDYNCTSCPTCDPVATGRAKIWLVPDTYLSCSLQKMTAWHGPGTGLPEILWDDQQDDQILFDDLSDDPGSCIWPTDGCGP